MSLAVGTKLGPYEVVAPLGAGGMGEVYRARDTKLGREVALKVLPEEFAADPERMARFEREAKVLASLNHPNIASIYGFEDSGSTGIPACALVMELVEGQTLAEMISGVGAGLKPAPTNAHAMAIDEALPIAKQIAEGLEYAHERGIVHRDLKPANVKITPDGAVKLLDFGLAKALEGDSASATDPSNSPTMSRLATQAGIILGTAAYMAPEQAKGKAVDRRADIWAFGCVLYEMLSGRKPFDGETVTDILAAVVRAEPDWSLLPAGTPAPVRRLLERCLQKDPKRRLQAVGEARIAIEETISGGGAMQGPPLPGAVVSGSRPAMGTSPLRRILPWALAGLLAAALATVAVLWKSAVSTPQRSFHQLTFDRGLIYAARFASDGRTVLYSAAWNDRPLQIYSTTPDSPEWRPLGLKDSTLYAVSPSQMAVSVGCRRIFMDACEGTLAVTPVSLAAPRQLVDNVISADWGPDGKELAAIRQAGAKFQVEFPLGKVIYQSANWLGFLRVSPDGQDLAFAAFDGPWADGGHVIIVSRDGKQIAHSQSFLSIEGLAWSPRGNEVWFGAALAAAWSNAIHALSRSSRERVVLQLPGMLRLYDVARDGRILLSQDNWRVETAFRPANNPKGWDLPWLDNAEVSDISPDGQQIAFFSWGEAFPVSHAFVRRTDGSPPVDLGRGEFSLLSPDGRWVLANVPGSSASLALLPVGAGSRRELEESGIHQFSTPGWMPDGKHVYFAGNDGQAWRLYVQAISGGSPRPLTPPVTVIPEANESHLVSPDGKWIFARDLNGNPLLYPVAGGKARPVPGFAAGDAWIQWASDGRSAYVCRNDITHAEVFRLDLASGKRQLLTELAPSDPAGLSGITAVRITPDGQFYAYTFNRFLSSLFLVRGVK